MILLNIIFKSNYNSSIDKVCSYVLIWWQNDQQNQENVTLKESNHKNIPRHLLTTEDAEMLKKVVLHSVATAFASIVCIKMVIHLLSIISTEKIYKIRPILDYDISCFIYKLQIQYLFCTLEILS